MQGEWKICPADQRGSSSKRMGSSGGKNKNRWQVLLLGAVPADCHATISAHGDAPAGWELREMETKHSYQRGRPICRKMVFFWLCLQMVPGLYALPMVCVQNAAAGLEGHGQNNQVAAGPHSRTVRVGLYENKPKIFTDEAGGAAGIFPTILNEIAGKENWRLLYVPCEWEACLDALEQGRLDLMPDVAFSPDRDRKFDFHSREVLNSWATTYASRSEGLNSIADLNGKRIAVLKGSIQQSLLAQMAKGFGLRIDFVGTQSHEEAFSATARGAADVAVANQLFGDSFHRQYGLEKTPIVFNPVSLYFATAAGANADLLRRIDANLEMLATQPGSVYYQALQAWIRQPPKNVFPRQFLWALGILGGVLLASVAFILVLRRQVRAATGDLRRANEMMRESEEKFRDIFEKHAAVKLIISPGSGNIVEANEAAERFYGWSREQLRKMRIQDITLPAAGSTPEREVVNENTEPQAEFRHRLADGSFRDVEVFSSTIVIRGEPFLHAVIHDITEKRKMEEHYRQAQKMESVGRLAGGIAHDYNNMLSVILGYTELALAKMSSSDPLRADLEAVLTAARRSVDINRQLLAFARKQTVEPKVIDLNEALAATLRMLRRLIGEDIELVWLPGEALWPVRIDPAQLDQILANLCTNARDAIGGVGKIVVETRRITVAEACGQEQEGFMPGDFTMLAVSDDGGGMDRETLSNIFEPFFTTKALGKGTGLGLATVHGIVQQNNGFIIVDSEPGRGTSFQVYLPRHEGAVERESVAATEDVPPGNGEMVLLVEDEEAILTLGKTILERLGYRVLTARAPGQAILLAREHAREIDLLITDLVMPEMNGRELAEHLASCCPQMKTLFMSGYSTDVITHRGVLDEGLHFIQKPFSLKDLSVKVRTVLGRG